MQLQVCVVVVVFPVMSHKLLWQMFLMDTRSVNSRHFRAQDVSLTTVPEGTEDIVEKVETA